MKVYIDATDTTECMLVDYACIVINDDFIRMLRKIQKIYDEFNVNEFGIGNSVDIQWSNYNISREYVLSPLRIEVESYMPRGTFRFVQDLQSGGLNMEGSLDQLMTHDISFSDFIKKLLVALKNKSGKVNFSRHSDDYFH